HIGAEFDRLAQHGNERARLIQSDAVGEGSERIDRAAARARLAPQDQQIGAEMKILSRNLTADAVQRSFEAKAGIDTHDHEIKHVGKCDAKALLQFPGTARDVDIRSQQAKDITPFVSLADWRLQMVQRIDGSKTFPAGGYCREGRVKISFMIDRAGNLLSSS